MNNERWFAGIVTLAISVTVLGCFALMADCSKSVSRTNSEAVEACVRKGGEWIGGNDGQKGSLDYCSEKKQ